MGILFGKDKTNYLREVNEAGDFLHDGILGAGRQCGMAHLRSSDCILEMEISKKRLWIIRVKQKKAFSFLNF